MSDRAGRRAGRLALLYPGQWRRRYPDFVEVLAAELAEHPRGVRRDVVRGAAVERLRAAGVLPAGPADQARSGLALVYAPLLPFAGLSIGMWSQLHTAAAAGGPGAPSPVLQAAGLLLAVGTALALASLAVAVPLVAAHARRRRASTARRTSTASTARTAGTVTSGPLAGPVLTLAAALAVLTACGWAADRSGWYSPAAAALPTGGLGHVLILWARGVIAAVTPAWVHPSLFGRMPTGDLLATLAAPFAALATGAALFRLMVRLPVWAPRRVHVTVAITAVGAMFLSAATTVRWLLAQPHQTGTAPLPMRAGQLAPGHTPWAVAVVLLVLAVTAAVGARRVLQGQWPPGPGDGRTATSSPPVAADR